MPGVPGGHLHQRHGTVPDLRPVHQWVRQVHQLQRVRRVPARDRQQERGHLVCRVSRADVRRWVGPRPGVRGVLGQLPGVHRRRVYRVRGWLREPRDGVCRVRRRPVCRRHRRQPSVPELRPGLPVVHQRHQLRHLQPRIRQLRWRDVHQVWRGHVPARHRTQPRVRRVPDPLPRLRRP